ncbi:glutamine--tRNA ligase/YqeY domain fusion protein [Humisphaera borealis]|uniref:Glutamine--tRNA ligase n=1 Tax=Humisphaera borealis TaxID=2807512 RepID=A0A7M2WUK0_9BACT|nr:glutamine--tRNA ligase/YqeY domain fusion protein [Humisphaera borealis]QOV88954.1 glutamine--tRNA ligase/YqeY domain fusion protein [Humisphaera borealis]
MSNPADADGVKTTNPAATKPAKPSRAPAASQPAEGAEAEPQGQDFIRRIIEEDTRSGKWGGRIATRFPPEPNGYLHIGHAKAICLNFGVAEEYKGSCNLRYDDTNPAKEEQEYVKGIEADVRWLGFKPSTIVWASDYFETMYDYAVELINKGLAYVDDQTAEQIRKSRGSLTAPGVNSPFRDRPIAENLDLLERMKKGEFPDGSRVLRAKIDMASPNLNLRDPVMYRILHETHHNTGDKWCIYPMYDWAHGFEDSIERITHSLCSLEFENHRPLYDWFIDAVNKDRPKEKQIWHPQQIEFARLNITYVMMSKRKLRALVEDGIVKGWDDPRMPTLSGYRRRGYTPESIRAFCKHIGMNKFNSTVEFNVLENFLREDLNKRAPRVMAVLRPVKVVITNYPEGQSEELDAVNNPEDPAAGSRKVPFGRVIYVEQEDFMEVPAHKYFRLFPGNEVRLRWAYFIKCTGVVKDANGNITEVHATYDPATRGGDAPDKRKVKATIHWVSAEHAIDAEVRLYDHLFAKEDPDDFPEGADWKVNLRPSSLEVVPSAKLEPSLRGSAAGKTVQFERLGYFTVDPDTTAHKLVFNRTVSLKDTWAKEQKK